ncbi:PfkB family carbohydrate kinase [Candidatus Laterigemmans baculatus]|uniref:PfkB family carbohydrate kinase n=1 Tax=Candidatus Laterigemmans baculatus TaxID=2770505 RepID=UPI0013DB528B|nr:PfkB family carbohydrate kinase [Candidatus Laterigemmans baculatus]
MSLLVVGSVAFDSIHTPTAERDRVLGGSAVYFSYAASYFTPVRLVGVVGEDWPQEHTEMLQARRVDTAGLQVKEGGKTFFWKGKYMPNMNDRETLEVELNVFGDFDPHVPEAFRDSRYVFLANGSPVVQAKVLDQMAQPALVVADTMDLWIQTQHEDLLKLLRRIDGLVINDSEARLLTEEENLVAAGMKIRQMGPRFVIVKKGEHGAMFFGEEAVYTLPAYPTAKVVDPTGAGDSFAGGMMGYIAAQDKHDEATLKRSLAYGTLVASFNVEDFSLERMQRIELDDLDQRLGWYREMLTIG